MSAGRVSSGRCHSGWKGYFVQQCRPCLKTDPRAAVVHVSPFVTERCYSPVEQNCYHGGPDATPRRPTHGCARRCSAGRVLLGIAGVVEDFPLRISVAAISANFCSKTTVSAKLSQADVSSPFQAREGRSTDK